MNKDLRNFFIFIVILVLASWWIITIGQNNGEINSQNDADSIVNETPLEDISQDFVIYDNFSSIEQYEHWSHMPLIYAFNISCSESQPEFTMAFDELARLTNNSLSFNITKDINSADIIINCEDNIGEITYDDDYYHETLGTSGYFLYSNTNIIARAFIHVTNSARLRNGCWYPAVEIHELLHAFGYGHAMGFTSIMAPNAIDVCEYYNYNINLIKEKAVDKSIIDDLKKKYQPRNVSSKITIKLN